jgi:hypothetical protein
MADLDFLWRGCGVASVDIGGNLLPQFVRERRRHSGTLNFAFFSFCNRLQPFVNRLQPLWTPEGVSNHLQPIATMATPKLGSQTTKNA